MSSPAASAFKGFMLELDYSRNGRIRVESSSAKYDSSQVESGRGMS